LNLGSKLKMAAMVAIAATWLFAGHPVTAAERAGQSSELTLDAEPDPRDEAGDGPLRPYGTDRIRRLARARLAETVLVAAVGAAAAVAGAVMGGLTFAIAAGAAGVYVILSLP
jgi:hypothetical protein